jgi:hypothetical protein
LRYFLNRGEKGAPGAAFLNEGGKAKTGMKELLYKNFTGRSSKQFYSKKSMEDGVFNPVGKTDSELSRISSASLLCGEK